MEQEEITGAELGEWNPIGLRQQLRRGSKGALCWMPEPEWSSLSPELVESVRPRSRSPLRGCPVGAVIWGPLLKKDFAKFG